MNLTIDPSCNEWGELISRRPSGELAGKPLESWRATTRRELGLPMDRFVLATGHQTLLWHPGILSKYLVTDDFAHARGLAMANLVVDQHVGDFDTFEAPIRKADGSLGVRTIHLCDPPPHADIPMGRHAAFNPPRAPQPDGRTWTWPDDSIETGIRRIFDAVRAHRDAPNAALQMAGAIADLMQWGDRAGVHPMKDVTATHLIGTSLARAIMQKMVDEPDRCIAAYNRAVASVPEAGIGELPQNGQRHELPAWRIAEDETRHHASLEDIKQAISGSPQNIDLLPRALFMTALVRLGMCDLFVHGTGGARYDRAMELWIKEWLGVEVGSIAVVTADVRLPLLQPDVVDLNVEQATHEARALWHDPMGNGSSEAPSETKRRMVAAIDALPRNSPQRRAQFLAMHERLAAARIDRRETIEVARLRAEKARRHANDQEIAHRRDWPFPLYPDALMDELAIAARTAATGASRLQQAEQPTDSG